MLMQLMGPLMQAAAASKQLRIACFDTESESLAMLEPTGSFPTSRGGHSVSTRPGCLSITSHLLAVMKSHVGDILHTAEQSRRVLRNHFQHQSLRL